MKKIILILAITIAGSAMFAQTLGKLTLIESNGKPIDYKPPYVGPTIYDLDNDGLDDLITGDYYGNFKFYKNVGTKSNPKYNGFEFIMAEGEKAVIKNW